MSSKLLRCIHQICDKQLVSFMQTFWAMGLTYFFIIYPAAISMRYHSNHIHVLLLHEMYLFYDIYNI